VILIGSGGDWLPREPQNWQTGDVFIDARSSRFYSGPFASA
jgi:hypothetical protein